MLIWGTITVTDGLSLDQYQTCLEASWHRVCQTQGKLLESSYRSHLCNPLLTKTLPYKPNIKSSRYSSKPMHLFTQTLKFYHLLPQGIYLFFKLSSQQPLEILSMLQAHRTRWFKNNPWSFANSSSYQLPLLASYLPCFSSLTTVNKTARINSHNIAKASQGRQLGNGSRSSQNYQHFLST